MTVSVWQRGAAPVYEADVVIVGAGIAGLGLAYWLTRLDPEHRVVVVERGAPASGATGRNAGFLTSGSLAAHAREVEAHGAERAWQRWQLTRTNHHLLREALLDEGGCGYARGGALSLTRTPEGREALAGAAEALATRGVEVSAVPDDHPIVRGYADPDRPDAAAGWLVAEDARVDPVALLDRLARRCGATVFGQHPVLGLDTGVDRVVVETARMHFAAPRVVLATNAYTAELAPELAPTLAPVRGQCLQTLPVPARIAHQIYATDDWVYLRQRDDGSLIVGGHRPVDAEGEVGTDDRLNPRVQAALDATLVRRFRGLLGGELAVARRWSGAMAYPTGGRPVVGPVPGRPGLWTLAGWSGHGMGLAFAHAAALAHRLLDRALPEALVAAAVGVEG